MKISVSASIAILFAGTLITVVSCDDSDNPGQFPILTSISPTSGIVGSVVVISGDQFIPTVPVEQGVGPHTNTSVVTFNGVIAQAPDLYQDSIGKQRIHAIVPDGASSGKIRITVNGRTVTSAEDFIITKPNYLPNVQVSTVSGWGQDIAVDKDGNLFVTHNSPNEIIRISPDGSTEKLWSSSSDTPWGVAVDASGNVLAAIIGGRILKISADGQVATLAGGSESGDVNGQGVNARFRFPLGLDVDKDGNVYIADLFSHKVKKVTPDGTVTTLAGSTQGYKDGIGDAAQFSAPYNVAVDVDGNVYVSDEWRLRKITPAGAVTTIAGLAPPGFRDGPVDDAQFSNINGIAKDDVGNIYVCDEGNFMVRRISPDGNVVTVAGSTFGYEDGLGSTALLTQPLGMTINSSGHIFVTQGGGLFKIRKITIN